VWIHDPDPHKNEMNPKTGSESIYEFLVFKALTKFYNKGAMKRNV